MLLPITPESLRQKRKGCDFRYGNLNSALPFNSPMLYMMIVSSAVWSRMQAPEDCTHAYEVEYMHEVHHLQHAVLEKPSVHGLKIHLHNVHSLVRRYQRIRAHQWEGLRYSPCYNFSFSQLWNQFAIRSESWQRTPHPLSGKSCSIHSTRLTQTWKHHKMPGAVFK